MADSQNDSKWFQGKIHDYQTRINELEMSHGNNLVAIEVLKARINEVENSRTNLKAKNGQLMNRVSNYEKTIQLSTLVSYKFLHCTSQRSLRYTFKALTK